MLNEPSDDTIDRWVLDFAARYAVVAIKAPIIAAMAFLSVFLLTGAPGKAFFIAAICLITGLFSTWRRFLEPLVFWTFVVAVVHWCEPTLLNSLGQSLKVAGVT